MDTPATRGQNTEEIQIHPLGLWFGVLAGPVAWATQLLVDYYLASLECAPRFTGYRVAGQSWFTVGIILMSLLAAVATIAAGLTAWHFLRRLGGFGGLDAGGVQARRAFMALLGVLFCTLFLLLILLSALPAFVSSQCATD
jgi:hypothetical protein